MTIDNKDLPLSEEEDLAKQQDKNSEKTIKQLSEKEISDCINTLEILISDTNQIFQIPKDRRLALLMAAGLLSRPSREEFHRRKKDAKKAEKRKIKEKDKHARNATGIRSAREATVFVAPKMLNAPQLESDEN